MFVRNVCTIDIRDTVSFLYRLRRPARKSGGVLEKDRNPPSKYTTNKQLSNNVFWIKLFFKYGGLTKIELFGRIWKIFSIS